MTDDYEPSEPSTLADLESLVRRLDQEASYGLAAVPSEAPGDVSRYLLFGLGEATYAARVGHVLEIATMPPITPVPNVPLWLRGVINLRGEILALIDLRNFLGLAPQPSDLGRLLVVRGGRHDAAGTEPTAGILVDAVRGIVPLDEESLAPPTTQLENPLTPFIVGVQEQDGRLVAVLDLDRLLNSPIIRRFGESDT